MNILLILNTQQNQSTDQLTHLFSQTQPIQ